VRIDQLLPVLGVHDAIGAHVLQTRRALRAAGYESDLYADVVDESLAAEVRPWLDGPGRISTGRAVLYHASTHAPFTPWLEHRGRLGERILVYYHNVTPAEYFDRWLPPAAEEMRLARQELAALAPVSGIGLAASELNERELVDLGYRPTVTAPLLVDLERYHDEADGPTLGRLRRRRERGGAEWLFVGRIAPNKCQHDIVAAFAAYRRLVDPKAHLTLVGGVTAPRYLLALRDMVDALAVEEAVDIRSGLSHPELLAHYAAADVFVCLSEHEGFCVPLLEAMEVGVPVVAFAAAAVPGTVGDAAVLLGEKDPLTVAAAVAGLLDDDYRRRALIDSGRRRARCFDLASTTAGFLGAVQRFAFGSDGGSDGSDGSDGLASPASPAGVASGRPPCTAGCPGPG
jgi:glycosyltransferase involved in cell wall biosynthesis